MVVGVQFVIGLFAGYLLEVAYRSVTNRKFTKPLLINYQMYGVSTVFIYFLSLISVSLVFKMILMAVFTTALEFLTGYGYLVLRGVRLWDYSGYSHNLAGFVCPRFSLYWLALSLAYYYLVLPLTVF